MELIEYSTEINVKLIKVSIIWPIKIKLWEHIGRGKQFERLRFSSVDDFLCVSSAREKAINSTPIGGRWGSRDVIRWRGGGQGSGLFIRRRILISAASIDQMKPCASLAGVGTWTNVFLMRNDRRVAAAHQNATLASCVLLRIDAILPILPPAPARY